VRCGVCDKSSPHVSRVIGVCAECLKRKPLESLRVVRSLGIREEFRADVGLPAKVPRSEGGFRCGLCVNECLVPRVEGASGFCGAWAGCSGVVD